MEAEKNRLRAEIEGKQGLSLRMISGETIMRDIQKEIQEHLDAIEAKHQVKLWRNRDEKGAPPNTAPHPLHSDVTKGAVSSCLPVRGRKKNPRKHIFKEGGIPPLHQDRKEGKLGREFPLM